LPKSAAVISVDYLMRDNYRLSRVERQRKAKKFSVKILTENFLRPLTGNCYRATAPPLWPGLFIFLVPAVRALPRR